MNFKIHSQKNKFSNSDRILWPYRKLALCRNFVTPTHCVGGDIDENIWNLADKKTSKKKIRYAANFMLTVSWPHGDFFIFQISKFHFFLEKSFKFTISIVKISAGDHVTEIKKQKNQKETRICFDFNHYLI